MRPSRLLEAGTYAFGMGLRWMAVLLLLTNRRDRCNRDAIRGPVGVKSRKPRSWMAVTFEEIPWICMQSEVIIDLLIISFISLAICWSGWRWCNK